MPVASASPPFGAYALYLQYTNMKKIRMGMSHYATLINQIY